CSDSADSSNSAECSGSAPRLRPPSLPRKRSRKGIDASSICLLDVAVSSAPAGCKGIARSCEPRFTRKLLQMRGIPEACGFESVQASYGFGRMTYAYRTQPYLYKKRWHRA